MWILVAFAIAAAVALFSWLVTFALDPIGSILRMLRVGSFLVAAVTGVLLFLFGAPFDTFGWTFILASAVWVLLLLVPEPRLRY